MEREKLEKELKMLEETYQNILEGGQEFQTRDGRVKQARLSDVVTRMNHVRQMLADINGGGSGNQIRMQFGGVG